MAYERSKGVTQARASQVSQALGDSQKRMYPTLQTMGSKPPSEDRSPPLWKETCQ